MHTLLLNITVYYYVHTYRTTDSYSDLVINH